MARRDPRRVAQGRRSDEGTYLAAHNARIKGRRGASRATIATAHAILVSAYHMLSRGVPYEELGDDYFHRRERDRADRYTRRLVRQLERLGHHVTLQPAAEVA